jgi:propanediol dehydratase small subunit
VDTAFNKEEFAAYSDQLRERYNAAMLDAFLNEGLNPKVVAKKQIRDCVRKIP